MYLPLLTLLHDLVSDPPSNPLVTPQYLPSMYLPLLTLLHDLVSDPTIADSGAFPNRDTDTDNGLPRDLLNVDLLPQLLEELQRFERVSVETRDP